jgi:hypothetical protein
MLVRLRLRVRMSVRLLLWFLHGVQKEIICHPILYDVHYELNGVINNCVLCLFFGAHRKRLLDKKSPYKMSSHKTSP